MTFSQYATGGLFLLVCMGRIGKTGVLLRLVGMDIDVLGFQLGVQDGLAGIQAAVPGEHVADDAGQGKVQKARVPEQLDGQQRGGQGQLVAPQNTATRPIAAEAPAGSPSSGPATQPKVAPTKKEGTTSPPLKPAARVAAVNSSFKRNAAGWAVPCSTAAVTTSMPAPL